VVDCLRQVLERAERRHRVLIDLERCEFIDLAVLTLLLRSGRRGLAEDRWVTIYGACGQPRRLFEALGLADALVLRDARRPSLRAAPTATRCPPASRPS
jgi:hypothetical protein